MPIGLEPQVWSFELRQLQKLRENILKKTLLLNLLRCRTFHIRGTDVPSSLFNVYVSVGWNLLAARYAVFSKTPHCLTRLSYKFVILCWYDAICTVAASWSSSVIFKSLARASVLVSLGISVRRVDIPIFVGIMAFKA